MSRKSGIIPGRSRCWIETRKTKSGTWHYIGQRDEFGKKLPLVPAGRSYKNALLLKDKSDRATFLRTHEITDTEKTVAEAYHFYLRYSVKNKRPATVSHIQDHLKLFVSRLGQRKLASISKWDVKAYKDYLEDSVDGKPRYSKNGVNIKLVALRAFLQYCADIEEWIPNNPALRVEKSPEEHVGRMLNEKEIELLIEKGCAFNPELRDLLIVFLYTGMRLGETFHLTKSQIIDGSIHIARLRNKTGKPKSIPIHPDVLPILNKSKFDRVFTRWTSVRTVEQAFHRALLRSGITGRVRIHDLRHTAASWLLRFNHMSLEEVSKFLGHVNLSTTQRYSHFENKHLQQKIAGLAYPVGKTKPPIRKVNSK